MNLNKLSEIQSAGATKVSENSNVYQAIVGGVPMDDATCRKFAAMLGWTGRSSNKGFEMIQKTDKYVRNFRRLLSDDAINGTDIMFESMRKTDTEKVSDRIKLVNSRFDLTIIHGTPGLGGSYALFVPARSTTHPEFACSSLKALCEYINEIV